jgi:hypothetical protein
VLAGGLGILAVLSILKATNEPLLSNKWLFYIPAEERALQWTYGTLSGQTIWVDYDERLVTAIRTKTEYAPLKTELDQFDPNPETRNFLISDITRMRAPRLGAPLPIEPDSFVIYDNGHSQIYHLRPRTLYQR